DRSFLDLSAGARLEVGENTGERFDSVLHAGAVTFHVRPGGARRWTVHAGPLTVEVTGTRFVVSRERTAVTVSVQRGHVRVMSEALEPPLRVLGAGQGVTVRTDGAGPSAE